MHLVIDIGNSRGKLALFQDQEILEHATWKEGEEFDLRSFLENERPEATGISSVRKELPSFIQKAAHLTGEPLLLRPDTPTPVRIDLEDPNTLGPDRLANAVGAYTLFPDSTVLVIDMGTCITYEIVENGTLIGGAIAPGVSMRAEAMHRSTGRLPFVELGERPERIEKDTKGALRSGIHYGVLDEIKARIHSFESDHPRGAVVLTGGDLSLVGKELKKGIFADPFLTLRGLNAILQQHMAGDRSDHDPSAP